MSENKQDSGADAPGMFLETREERIKLLKSGFTGNQIEALYFVLNHFETVRVDWDDTATNRIRRIRTTPSFNESDFLKSITTDSVRVKAAPSLGMTA